MIVEKTVFEGLLVIKPKRHYDKRGFFSESFRLDILEGFLGKKIHFVQENQTHSKHGVIRGLHYQMPPFSQSKLIQVMHGKVLDVVVDLRSNSKTFKKIFAIELSSDNNLQLFIPRGFAHGYCTLSESSIFQYKVDNYYHKQSECSIQYDDPNLKIDWRLSDRYRIVSEKDKQNQSLEEAVVFDSNIPLYE